MSSGVCIHSRIIGVKRLPRTVITTPATSENAMSVCIALSRPILSRAPKLRDITTPAPMAMPLKKPTIMFISGDEEETAARASAPM